MRELATSTATNVSVDPNSHYSMCDTEIFAKLDTNYFWTSQGWTLQDELKISLFDQPSQTRIIMVTGSAGLGVSTLLTKFAAHVPAQAANPIDFMPVVKFSPAGDYKPGLMADALANQIGWPLRLRMTSKKAAEDTILEMLQQAQTKMLIIPRAHFLSSNGRSIAADLRPLMVRLLDDAKITIVLSGTDDLKRIVASIPEAVPAIQSQFEWKPETFVGSPNCHWVRFCAAMLDTLAIDTACFRCDGFAESMHHASQGRIPVAVRLIRSTIQRMASRLSNQKGGPDISQVRLIDQPVILADAERAFDRFEPAAVNPFTPNWKDALEAKRMATFENSPVAKNAEQLMMEKIR